MSDILLESNWLVFGLFLVALVIGFWQGHWYANRSHSGDAPPLNKSGLAGLNFLLKEKPDVAIDTFVRSLDVNSDTLETHLGLGKLLRRQGEVDRAIKVHQNLLARPNLSVSQQHQAEYELALDFVKSGLYDRAEHLLLTLNDRKSQYTEASLLSLIDIYQSEKEWHKALSAALAVSAYANKKDSKSYASLMAHFCCEIAVNCMANNDLDSAKRSVKQALIYDKSSLRANVLACRYDVKPGNLRKALSSLKKLLYDHPAYIDHVLPTIASAYQVLDDPRSYRYFLESFYSQFGSFAVMKALSDEVAQLEGVVEAAEYVSSQIKHNPSLKGINLLLSYYLLFSRGRTLEHLQSLEKVLMDILKKTKPYRCNSCGFKTHELHWHCPTCRTWDSIQPADE
ncbi:lipopolysaccharide assembly protein LapB [bacterium]|nr:lipopolysaccharide assembly protein LapB [bacterium]